MIDVKSSTLSDAFLSWPKEWENFTPYQSEGMTHWNWKVPYESETVSPDASVATRKAAIEVLIECLKVASENRCDGDYEIAALVTWPDVHSSEICVFYDSEYADRFRPSILKKVSWDLTNEDTSLFAKLPVSHNIFDVLGIVIPQGFEAAGVRYISTHYDEHDYVNQEHWTVMECPT